MKTQKKGGAVKWILIAICVIFLAFFLILPLIYILSTAFRDGIPSYIKAVTDEYAVKAALLTLKATFFAVVINTIFGLFASWCICKFTFRGKKVLSTFIDLPVTVSPIIAGLIYILTFGRQSFLYPILDDMGIQIIFAVPGIILATIFVTFPFISRELIPVLTAQGTDEEEAAALMRKTDKQRSVYYNYYTEYKWGDINNYDIALDRGKLGIERCVDILENLYRTL